MQTIKITLKNYYIDTTYEKGREAYEKLCEEITKKGHKLFDSVAGGSYKQRKEYFKQMIGPKEIDTEFLFDNQSNTIDGFRIFDWSESIFPNKKIKEGYYIDTGYEELQELRKITGICGYCSKQYPNKINGFCESCLGSEYLNEKYYSLLEIVPINKRSNYKYNKCLPNEYIRVHKIKQLKKEINKKQESIEYFKTSNNKLIEQYEYEKILLEKKLELLSK